MFSALVNLLYLTPTLYMMQVYDRVVPTGGLITLVLITAVAVFALAALAALDWLRGRLMLRPGLRLDRLLAGKVLARVVDLQAKSPNTQALREFDNVRGAIGGQGMLALFDAPWTPIYLLCCFLLHPAIGPADPGRAACVLFALAWLNERDTRPRLKQGHAVAEPGLCRPGEASPARPRWSAPWACASPRIARQIEQRSLATAAQADAQLAGGQYSGAIKFLRLVLQSAALGLAAYLAVKSEISPGAIIAASVLLSRAVRPDRTAGRRLAQPGPGRGQLEDPDRTVRRHGRASSGSAPPCPTRTGRLQVEGVSVQISRHRSSPSFAASPSR